MVKVNEIDEEFIVDTGLQFLIMSAEKTEIQNVKHRYQDVNNNEVKFPGKIPADNAETTNKRCKY